MPELDPSGKYRFKFVDYDLSEDLVRHELFEKQIAMGLKTPEMIAEEEGIDLEALRRTREERMQRDIEISNSFNEEDPNDEEQANRQPREEEQEAKNLKDGEVEEDAGMDDYMDSIKEQAVELSKQSLNFDSSPARS